PSCRRASRRVVERAVVSSSEPSCRRASRRVVERAVVSSSEPSSRGDGFVVSSSSGDGAVQVSTGTFTT
ncbi:MAG: hypothetical protein ACM3ZE_24660, partial [Myxococcales bacterium]